MKNIITSIKSWFHTEVDDITKPFKAAIAALAAFEAKTVAKVEAAKSVVTWGEAEITKAKAVAAKLAELVS